MNIYVVMECSNYGSWPLRAFTTLQKARSSAKREGSQEQKGGLSVGGTIAKGSATVWYAVERIKLED